jgi:hypothetical protein
MSTTIERVRLFAAVVLVVAGMAMTGRSLAGYDDDDSRPIKMLCENGLCRGKWTETPCDWRIALEISCCCEIDFKWRCVCRRPDKCTVAAGCQP